MIFCDVPVIYEPAPCGFEDALGCFDPNINRISIREGFSASFSDMVRAHECGH